MGLKFTDPPTKWSKRNRYDWDKIYPELRENPGEWALLGERGTVSTYNAVTQGKISNFHPSMGVEIRTANNDLNATPRTCDLFVRYNPDKDESLTVKEREKMWVQYRKNRREKEKKMTVSTVEADD